MAAVVNFVVHPVTGKIVKITDLYPTNDSNSDSKESSSKESDSKASDSKESTKELESDSKESDQDSEYKPGKRKRGRRCSFEQMVIVRRYADNFVREGRGDVPMFVPPKKRVYERKSHICQARGCKSRAYYGYQKGERINCRTHAASGMFDTKRKVCDVDGCHKRPSFGNKFGVLKHCKVHKEKDEKDILSVRCKECRQIFQRRIISSDGEYTILNMRQIYGPCHDRLNPRN
jgi:hypothetical protein